MDARQLGYFLAVVDHNGFGRAAEHVHIAQPSLSQAIAGLERELGVPLFHRVGRGVVLSEAGRQLVEPARQVLRDLDAAKAVAQSVKGVRRGRLDLVSMPSPGIEPLTTLLDGFARAHPGITLTVDGAFTPEQVVESVRSGVAEIGLLGSAGDPHAGELTVLPLEDQPLVLVSPPGHDLPGGDVVRREHLRGRRMIVSQRGSLMRSLVDDVLASGTEVHLAAEVAHRTSILPLVLAGFGHAVLPSSWTTLAERAGAVVHRIEPEAVLRVALVSRPSGLTPAARAFLDVAAAYAQVP
ncbi:LysR family transcriptional regulator [Prauserella flavalba]|uniref:LysR family transcriptional regulator n=1 Tax=Prauserella flavalba TaxID=1477506 RepID=A0A318LR99_9PSEU|nr:LysR family transcriptional regulator [Prauserella flavalba]PXY36130.1 LysR family transcriptional regulator [Prauserella flavalba]